MAKFYGIGVGPGDPELLTIKAVKVLKNVDVLLLPDSQKGKDTIAYEIAAEYVSPKAKIITVEFPMVADETIIDQAGKLPQRLSKGMYGKARIRHLLLWVTLPSTVLIITY